SWSPPSTKPGSRTRSMRRWPPGTTSTLIHPPRTQLTHGAGAIVGDLPEGQVHDRRDVVPGPDKAAVVDHPADIGQADRAQLRMVDHAAELAGAAAVVGDQVGTGGRAGPRGARRRAGGGAGGGGGRRG